MRGNQLFVLLFNRMMTSLSCFRKCEDALQSADTREKAGTLLNSLLTLSFVCFLILWEQVLHKINVVQKRLQSPRMNLREAAADIDSLIDHFINKRSELCQNATDKGLQNGAYQQKDASCNWCCLTLVEEIDRVMKLSLDRLVQEICDRSKRLQDLNSKFGFLLDVQSLIASDDVNEDSLLPHCVDFAIAYEGDVDASSYYWKSWTVGR